MDFVLRLLMIGFALCAAILAAGATIALGMFAPEWGFAETDPVDRMQFFVIAFVATSFAGAVAFFPALVAIAFGEALAVRTVLYYAAAGGAVGLLGYFGSDVSAHLDQATEMTPVRHGLELVVASGIAGGLVYWLLAGRNAGRWRTAPR